MIVGSRAAGAECGECVELQCVWQLGVVRPSALLSMSSHLRIVPEESRPLRAVSHDVPGRQSPQELAQETGREHPSPVRSRGL